MSALIPFCGTYHSLINNYQFLFTLISINDLCNINRSFLLFYKYSFGIDWFEHTLHTNIKFINDRHNFSSTDIFLNTDKISTTCSSWNFYYNFSFRNSIIAHSRQVFLDPVVNFQVERARLLLLWPHARSDFTFKLLIVTYVSFSELHRYFINM